MSAPLRFAPAWEGSAGQATSRHQHNKKNNSINPLILQCAGSECCSRALHTFWPRIVL